MVLRNAPHRMRRMSIDGQDRSQQDFKVQNQHNEPRETGDLPRRESNLGILNRIKTRPESLHAYHRKFPVRNRIPHSEVHTHGFSSSAQWTSHLTSRIQWESLNCNPSKSTNQGIGLLEQNAHRFSMRSTHIRPRCKISTSRESSLHGMYGRPKRQYPTHDNFDCVVTPNVRQRLVERNVLCIVVDVRLRTKNAHMKSAVKRRRPSETAINECSNEPNSLGKPRALWWSFQCRIHVEMTCE